MILVWYDPDCDQIWIGDRPEPFPPGTLTLNVTNGVIHIHRVAQVVSIAAGRFTDFCDGTGHGFASHAEALAYLTGVFARRPAHAASISTASGAPDDQSGHAGDLYLDAETGDLYRKET